MVARAALAAYLEELLRPGDFEDYCPNGLQVEGRAEIRRLLSGVTACQELVEQAAAADACALLVHHGYFWRGEPAVVTGMKAARLRRLLAADLNLFAYHLPLDAHPELGNNVQLARRLGLEPAGPLVPGCPERGCLAAAADGPAPAAFGARLEARLGRAVLRVGPEDDRALRRVGLCTGAGQGMIEAAAAAGADAFVSGEISEQTTHAARELGLHFYACGHHATERYGVQALGAHLAERYGLEHRFIDIDNPA